MLQISKCLIGLAVMVLQSCDITDNRRDLLCGNWESVEGKPDVLIYKEGEAYKVTVFKLSLIHISYCAELRMKIRKLGVVIHQRLVHFQHLERLPEDVRLQENRLGVNARLLEHGEETVVFLLAETDGVSEHRRIEFGISPAFVSFFFTHITLDLAV